MKAKKTLFILLIILSVISCKDEKQKEITKDFIRTYEGNINEKYEIMMKITSDNGKISGSYFYKKKGIKIGIKGSLKDDGSIILNEFDKNGNQTGIFEGNLKNEHKIIGKWSKPNGKNNMDFKLIESNSNYKVLKKQTENINYNYISGTYVSTFNNGHAEIRYLGKNKFSFEIDVTSYNGMAMGRIKENGKVTNGIGYFGKKDCELTFLFKKQELKITQEGCINYSGRSSFDGEFIKE
jgi:hypothetical protein